MKSAWSALHSLRESRIGAVRLELRPENRDRSLFDYQQAMAPDYYSHVVDMVGQATRAAFVDDALVAVQLGPGGRHRRLPRFRSRDWTYRRRRIGSHWSLPRAAVVVEKAELEDLGQIFLAVARQDFGGPRVSAVVMVGLSSGRFVFQYDDRGALVGGVVGSGKLRLSRQLEAAVIEWDVSWLPPF